MITNEKMVVNNTDSDICEKIGTSVKIKPKTNIKKPSLFDVVYLNDNVTSFEFVVNSLVSIFSYKEEPAVEMANKVHEEGQATVATLTFELAEQKASEVAQAARTYKFPLVIKVVPSTHKG